MNHAETLMAAVKDYQGLAQGEGVRARKRRRDARRARARRQRRKVAR